MNYVQHISGRGKKYQRIMSGDTSLTWCVASMVEGFRFHLPVDDYMPCEPPERWVDVTEQVQWSDPDNKFVSEPGVLEILENNRLVIITGRPRAGYRLRRVQVSHLIGGMDWAFIVERKES